MDGGEKPPGDVWWIQQRPWTPPLVPGATLRPAGLVEANRMQHDARGRVPDGDAAVAVAGG